MCWRVAVIASNNMHMVMTFRDYLAKLLERHTKDKLEDMEVSLIFCVFS